MKKLISILIVISLVLTSYSMAFADSGTDGTNAPMGDPPTTYGWDVTKTLNGDAYGSWTYRDSVKLPMTLTYNYEGDVNTTVSGSFSAPLSQIETTLGFSVSYQYSWSKSIGSGTYPASLNGKTIRIKSRSIYHSYAVTQQQWSKTLGVKTLIGSPTTTTVKKPYATDWSYDIM